MLLTLGPCIGQDGSLDTSFNPGSGANNPINTLTMEPDGRMLISGTFTDYDGTSRSKIARLFEDGSLDTSFDPGAGVNGTISSIVRQDDGKYIIAGSFTAYNGVERNQVARIFSDGTLDDLFNPGSGIGTTGPVTISVLLPRPDGKVLIGGCFPQFDGVVNNGIVLLDTNGDPDPSFSTGSGLDDNTTPIDGQVWDMVPQPDGKILIAGAFTGYNGSAMNRIARLNADGTLDGSFSIGTGFDDWSAYVWDIALAPDGRTLAGGHFSSYNASPANNIILLNSDGSMQQTYAGLPATSFINRVLIQPDGNVLAAHWGSGHLVRFDTGTGLDIAFEPGSGTNGGSLDPTIFGMTLQADGKIVLVGSFTSFNGEDVGHITRLNNSISSSITEPFAPDLLVFTDRSSRMVNVTVKEIGAVGELTVFDMSGRQVVATQTLNTSGGHLLDMRERSAGTYVLSVRLRDRVINRRFQL